MTKTHTQQNINHQWNRALVLQRHLNRFQKKINTRDRVERIACIKVLMLKIWGRFQTTEIKENQHNYEKTQFVWSFCPK
jgi:hypothetical protein